MRVQKENTGHDAADPFTPERKAYVEHLLERFHVPSISIGIIQNGQTYFTSFGDALLSKEKATPDSLYYLASVTKSFTATTLLSVLESLDTGRRQPVSSTAPRNITLKTKLQALMPDDFALADEHATAHAALEDALGHRLGVGSNDYGYGGEGYTLRDAVRSLRHLPMTGELREKHEYLNMGYMTIQHVVETLTGAPIEEAHREYIWGPLGMRSTYPSLQIAKEAKETLCTGYTYDPVGKVVQETAYVEDYPLIGGGGLISSIRDMTAYLHAVMSRTLPLGETYQKQLLTPLSIPERSPEKHSSQPLYCLGWVTNTYRGTRVVSHNGGINGFGSQLLYLPDKEWGVALLANGDHAHMALIPLVQTLMDDALRVPAAQREKSREDELSEKLEHSADKLLTARERIYPRVPEPPLPMALPLEAYAGRYHSLSHQTLVLEIATPRDTTPVKAGTDKVLRTEMTRLGDFVFEMEHVSGEYFVGWEDLRVPTPAARRAVRVQFIVGAEGTVKRMGVNFASITEEGDDLKMTWFDKMD